jgi:hypothetical protein
MAHKWSKVTVFCEGWAARQQPEPEPDRASSPCAASPAHPANGDQQSQRCGYPLPTEVFASKSLKRSSHNRYHPLHKPLSWQASSLAETPPLRRRDREESPRAGHALEFMRAAVLEFEP